MSWLIDHLLIAVSDSEFDKWVQIAEVRSDVEYKKSTIEGHLWEGCYVMGSCNRYIEILRRSNYPGLIGIALSRHGYESQVMEELSQQYPEWEFQTEIARRGDDPWYSAYFSKQTETENTFLWFMEYQGCAREERSRFSKDKIINSDYDRLRVRLTSIEVEDLLAVVSHTPLLVSTEENYVHIGDSNLGTITLEISGDFGDRVVW